jgi:Flp pilus assembly protein TadD
LQYRSQGNYDEAIAALRHSVALDPTHLEGRVILGWTLHLAEQPTVAMEVLQQAVIRAPDDVSALNALGIVYLVKGNLSQAVDTHERAIALDPKNEIAHYNLSLAYQRLQQSAAAIAYARTATALEPGNPHPWMALAIAQWGAGNVEAAQQAYRQALQLDSRYASEPFLSSLEVAGFNARQIEAAAAVRAS